MDVELKMPDLSTTGSEVTLLSWLVDVGEEVKRGQPLVEIETDKATMDVEAVVAGKVKELCAEPGTEVAVGAVIAIIEKAGAAPAPAAPAADASAEAGTSQKQAPARSASKPKPGSLFAKKKKPGTESPAKPNVERLDSAIAIVGKRMQQSKQTAPHFYLQTSANADPMRARRGATEPKLVWDAFFVKAVGAAMQEFDRMCCFIEGENLVQRDEPSVGVAVSLDEALYVLSVRDPASKSLEDISGEIRGKVEALRAGDKEARKLQPACLTVTNLGAANVEAFGAIINPPESAILAVGKIEPKPVVVDGEIAVQNRVTLVLSVDHRVVNGRYAADFLGRIVQELEETT
jgi:pyruvate/2-oxoglutarate dehydrogenase complex dihydrolipoamide acyltransferase (E2) component